MRRRRWRPSAPKLSGAKQASNAALRAVGLRSPAEVDEQVLRWLQQAYDESC